MTSGNDEIKFAVPGVPVGKGRPRATQRGKHIALYTPEKTASYENLVKFAAQKAMNGQPLISGPVEVGLFLYCPVPASWSSKKRQNALDGKIFPTTKPDIDNVTKGVFDACNGIVWVDDKQVCVVLVRKQYATVPQAVVRIKAMVADG